jgi:hypothetical protein
MALITEITHRDKERVSIHEPTPCTFSTFVHEGVRILQLDTYGAAARAHPEKVSQSIQLNVASAARVKQLIDEAFPDLANVQ